MAHVDFTGFSGDGRTGGDNARAHGQLVESLTLLRELGDRWQTAHTLEVLAGLEIREEHLVRAAQIFGVAEVFRKLSAPRCCYSNGISTNAASPVSSPNWTRKRFKQPGRNGGR